MLAAAAEAGAAKVVYTSSVGALGLRGEHYVNGYYRNGTYVPGHYRTNRDGSFSNNYSSVGNVNPHTGKAGTRRR